jgi:hypothetical protein
VERHVDDDEGEERGGEAEKPGGGDLGKFAGAQLVFDAAELPGQVAIAEMHPDVLAIASPLLVPAC